MNDIDQKNNDNNKNIIYSIDSGQRGHLEKRISQSILQLEKIFQKEEILKFLFKNIEEGKSFSIEEHLEDNQDKNEKEHPLSEEELNQKKDEFCRELKKIFDSINPETFQKYNNRIASAAIKIMQEIYTRKILVEKNPLIRKVEIKKINPDSEENKAKYNKLNIIKNVIQDTIYLSKYYIEELNNSNDLLFHDLNQFYNDISDLKIVNYIDGEEKTAKDDDFIKKVVYLKEKKGKDFINETKNYIGEKIKEQNVLNNKILNLVDEFNDLKKQQENFDKYCNDKNSVFSVINQCDFYE